MLSLAIILTAAAPDLAALDDANLALTSCQFAVIRAEIARHSGRDRIAAALAAGCTAEEARYRTLAIDNRVARGKSPRSAVADVDRELSEGRSGLIAEYERFAALGLF